MSSRHVLDTWCLGGVWGRVWRCLCYTRVLSFGVCGVWCPVSTKKGRFWEQTPDTDGSQI
ncbi:hypothetical protein [Nostoc sp. UHCC 0252]|uniref:hypothetical protein n=1 Tax=Nostoc sp. UHCC 0252 TaxID=3110241 RepID=UPI002B219C2B|nr:hypothetical protein [Nostoc sp. UHCC 0252]MEA5605998.1 hypothetical protein [Nostoc sp. UHCC 0252]